MNANEDNDLPWRIAPCTVCGTDIEDEYEEGSEWICSSCWPSVERDRLRAQLAGACFRLEQSEAIRVQLALTFELAYDSKKEELAVARAALRKYGAHDSACRWLMPLPTDGQRGPCSCGLEEALRIGEEA